MSQPPTKPEKLALEVVERFCNKFKDNETQRSFRSRARTMITDLYVNGTAYVISMCAARSSAEAVELGLTAPRLDDLLEEVRKNSLARQELGYAIYGAVLLYALRQLGVLENCRTLGDALRELMDNHFADRKAYYFASWLKRFTEAYIHE